MEISKLGASKSSARVKRVVSRSGPANALIAKAKEQAHERRAAGSFIDGGYDMVRAADCNAGATLARWGMKLFVVVATLLLGVFHAETRAGEPALPPLAQDVWKASGGENWSKVKELRFTFVVEADGKTVASAQHRWNVAAATDEVTWKDKHVVVDLNAPPADGDGKAGYARWVNDSYWLIAPLKLRDRGVTITQGGTKNMQGTECETLNLKFGTVGLTPTDQYTLYVDPKTKLLSAWDYTPKEGAGMQATWEKYETFGGLTLATEHHFSGKTIKFTGVEVVADK